MTKRGRKSLSPKDRQQRNAEWKAMRDNGYSYPSIAYLYGVDHSTVMYALNPDFAMLKRADMRKYQALHKAVIGHYLDGKNDAVR